MTGVSTADGAKTSVYLATSADIDGVTGEYFVDSRRSSASKLVRDNALTKSLWDQTEKLLSNYLSD